MKFLVLGCNGMVGHTIGLYLAGRRHQVKGIARTRSRMIDTIVGDVRDTEMIRQVLSSGDYDAVVNCIGVLNQFAESDHEAAVYLNAYFPHYLAKVTKNLKTMVVHISTDCVFSGKKGGYEETDFCDGETFYDRSKALGELCDQKNMTIRSSIIGPDLRPEGIGLMNWFLQQKGSVKGYKNAIWTGQTSLQQAKTIEFAVKEKATGLYHMVPQESISKYELLVLCNKYLRKRPINIDLDESFRVDKSLRRTNYKMLDYVVPGYEKQMYELGQWLKEHKSLYPHYEI